MPDPCQLVLQSRTFLRSGVSPKAVVPLLDEALTIGVAGGMDRRQPPCSLIVRAQKYAQRGKADEADQLLSEALEVATDMGLHHPDRKEQLEMTVARLERRVAALEDRS